jgi:Mannosyl-glycoprotein endo-beta-N-acetylglucosaminidase
MKRYLQSGVVIFAGVLGIAAGSVNPAHDVTKTRRRFDMRSDILRKFLRQNHSPAEDYAEMFVAEADTHGLDWRLLPSISVVESGAGRQARGNNLFGWSNGKARFRTIGDSIHEVATSLSSAKPYAGKDIPGKLAAFNTERPDYSSIVMAIMKQISPRALCPGTR